MIIPLIILVSILICLLVFKRNNNMYKIEFISEFEVKEYETSNWFKAQYKYYKWCKEVKNNIECKFNKLVSFKGDTIILEYSYQIDKYLNKKR